MTDPVPPPPPPPADGGSLVPEEEPRYAGFWIRVGAFLIDLCLTGPLFVAALFLPSPLAYLLVALLTVLYKPVLEGLFGGTVGKLLLGLRVIDRDFVRVGWMSAFIRNLFFILAALPGSFLQFKMKSAGISFTDMTELQQFQQEHVLLQGAGNVLNLIVVLTVLFVAFNARKKGLHDMLADSLVVYRETLPRV